MKKYLLTARFEWSEAMMNLIPEHREIINSLIDSGMIDHYVVSMEVETVWVTLNAKTKRDAKKALSSSPLFKFWKVEVNELMVWDGQNYRLPALQLN